MVPQGSSPETYDPTPQQLVALNQSDAYLRIGHIGFEQAWMERIKANNPHIKVFDTSEGIDFIRGEGHWHGNHFHQGGIEPHVWNSATNAILIVQNICKSLCQLDSINQNFYQERTDSLKQIIVQTDKKIRQLLQSADSTFLIYHPALSYFARDYGLKQISIEDNGKHPSPASLKTLIDTCRKEGVRVIFVQQEFDQHNAQLIASELGIEIVPINPLSYHWEKEMIRIAETLNGHL
jgi:zinc transport system substrate-binding protein